MLNNYKVIVEYRTTENGTNEQKEISVYNAKDTRHAKNIAMNKVAKMLNNNYYIMSTHSGLVNTI